MLNGLKHGFPLVDCDTSLIKPAKAKNHISAINHREQVESRLRDEIDEGNYIVVDESDVKLISPIAAIEKTDGDVRLIHDLSSPINLSLNDYAAKDECRYESIKETIPLLKPGMFMAKCDLRWAYRHVPIKKAHYSLTGLQWTFSGQNMPTTLVDSAFPFGARKSPSHFNRITKAIKRCMLRLGFNCAVYLDDFLLFEHTFNKCALALASLIKLLRKLSFRINWKKVCDPQQSITFLGLNIDTQAGTLSLAPEKVDKLNVRLTKAMNKKRLGKKDLQCLSGHLAWATNVIEWGRAHMNSLFQALRQLKEENHKTRVTPEIKADIKWWLFCLNNNKPAWRALWPPIQPSISIETDSCLAAGGAFLKCNSAWIHTNWALDRPALMRSHINVKELAIIKEAIMCWGPCFPNHRINVFSDNTTAVYSVNTGATKNPIANSLIKEIARIARLWGLTIVAHHIPGALNPIADAISRLHIPGQFYRLSVLLSEFHFPNSHPTYNLLNNMSPLTLFFLLPQVHKFHSLYKNWMQK